MKKQVLIAFGLLLLIPVVTILGGLAFSMINPEIAAGHPNYARNYHILHLVKMMMMWGSFAVAGILWLAACILVIRSKRRSLWWLMFAALGPLGFAVLVMLRDETSAATDPYARFVRNLNGFVRAGYEVCLFIAISEIAFQAMVLKSKLMIWYESVTTGVSIAQIMDVRNASSGMGAFGEGLEVMYMVVLLYLLWPAIFNFVARATANTALTPQKSR